MPDNEKRILNYLKKRKEKDGNPFVCPNGEISRNLGIGLSTVKIHINLLKAKNIIDRKTKNHKRPMITIN